MNEVIIVKIYDGECPRDANDEPTGNLLMSLSFGESGTETLGVLVGDISDVFVEDADLLLAAQAIFGENLVIKAEKIEQSRVDANNDSITHDSTKIRITFFSGNIVEFWNSEWGQIRKV